MASWQTVKTVLDEALDRPAEARESYLAEACGEDRELVAAVKSLLQLEEESGEFMIEPIFTLHGSAGEGDPPPDPNLGRLAGRFRLVSRLAGGGMGAVYLGERADGPFEQRAAVKLIKRGMDSEEILRRFALERQILARLSHDSIARLLDGGTAEDGLPYFALEYVDGLPLDRYCAEHRLGIDRRLALFLEVCDAVAFAHRSLVIHRDLKPGNILVTPEGRPKLLDFGIAKLLTPDGTPEGAATVLGAVPMTPGYASPEQLRGQALTTATDVYSLGVILYELLTGRKPYQVETSSVGAWLAAVEAQEPPRPSAVGEGPSERQRLKGDLDRIVAKAMARDAAERYGSVAELAEDLTLYREGLPIRSRPQTWRYRSAKFLRRHALGVGAAAAFLMLLVSATTVMALQRRQIAAQRDLRVAERDRARAAEKYLTNVFEAAGTNRAKGQEMTARELIDHGARELEHDRSLPEATRAVLLDVNGRVYRKLGLSQKALRSLEEALEIRRSLPSEDRLLAETMTNLAYVLWDVGGDDGRPEGLLRDAVAIWRKQPLLEREDRETFAATLSNFASVLAERGMQPEVRSLYEEALAIKKQLFGADSPEYAKTLNLLAVFLQNQGDYQAAEPMFRTVLAIRRLQSGLSAQEELLTSLNNLGVLKLAQRETREASALLNEDWPWRQATYAENPGKLAIGWTSQGLLAEAEGRFIAAREAHQKALALVSESNSERAASSRRNLAALLSRRPELGDCEPLARAALDGFLATKPLAWQVADAQSVLGGCLLAKTRLEEAEPLLVGGYEKLKAQTQRRPYLPEARERLVELYRQTGRAEMAAALETEGSGPSAP